MYPFFLIISSLIKRLGADLRLSNRTIQFTPVKYLVPVAEKYPELKQQFELARTNSEQMKKGLKEGSISQWYTLVKEVATMLKEDLARRK